MHIFYVDLTVPQIFPRKILNICLRAIHYMKRVSTLTEIIQILGKHHLFFSKSRNLVPFVESQYVSRVLRIKKFQTQNRTLASNRTLSIGENVKKRSISVFRADDFPSKLNSGGINRSLSESKNHDGKHLNVSPTMPKTKRKSERRGLPSWHLRR